MPTKNRDASSNRASTRRSAPEGPHLDGWESGATFVAQINNFDFRWRLSFGIIERHRAWNQVFKYKLTTRLFPFIGEVGEPKTRTMCDI